MSREGVRETPERWGADANDPRPREADPRQTGTDRRSDGAKACRRPPGPAQEGPGRSLVASPRAGAIASYFVTVPLSGKFVSC